MSNALGEAAKRLREPEDGEGEEVLPNVAELLANVDQDRATAIAKAFEAKAIEIGADMGTSMWGLAMLQARILARAPMGTVQMWTAARFSELVQIALPAAILAQETAKRRREGKPPHDG